MSTNVYHLQLQAGGGEADTREPLAEAVGEVSARVAALNDEHRRLYSRVNELRSADPALRRKRPRTLPVDLLRPVTFFSIEEAAPEAQARQVRRA